MSERKHAWAWVPSLFYIQGLPYVMVMVVSSILYKDLGIGNKEMAFYTSMLYLPWVIKPFWSPIVDVLKTKRLWTISMQVIMSVTFIGLAFSLLSESSFFFYSLFFFWILAFCSATHDVAVDGFYMLSLSEKNQAFFVGVRTTVYRLAILSGQGVFVFGAGVLTVYFTKHVAWAIVMLISGFLMICGSVYNHFMLPKVESTESQNKESVLSLLKKSKEIFTEFLQKENIYWGIAFILTFRFSEGLISKMASAFMLDSVDVGGLGLNTEQVGFIYGTLGMGAIITGGLIGGVLASKKGLKYWLFPMLLAVNLPNFLYAILAYIEAPSLILISSVVIIEQFGYGFGMTGYILYVIYISAGKYKTTNYAISTGLTSFGMMVPGALSGFLQESLGYEYFYIFSFFCMIPALFLYKKVSIDASFARK